MKKNSLKKILSVVLLLTMLVSMLPSAAFAEEAQPADAQTAAEETVKVEENKDEAKEEAKAENKDEAKEEAKTENKDEVKEETKTENKDEVKEETPTENKNAVKEEPAAESEEEPKGEPKEESEEKSEEETKDEAEDYSDAVKAFLAAVEAINADNPVDAVAYALSLIGGLNDSDYDLPAVAAAYEKLLGLIGYEADTLANNSVPLTLTVSSYGAPFINGNTGEHTVNSYKAYKNISRSAVGSDNASGSATARFVGSNETGWTLVIDVEIGNYSETWTTNARITNKDMSAATGSVTFGLSFNSSGGTSTYIHISGGTSLPVTELDTTLKYDANCTDSTGAVPASETKSVEKGKTGSFTVKGQGDMVRPGYTFAGWTENAAGTGTVYNANDTITVAAGTTKTLYAKWEKIPEQVEITLTYDPNGGNGDQHKDTVKVTEGKSYTFTIKSPDDIGITAKDGYEFTGWNTKADGTGDAVTGTITISASTMIYAQWKKLPTTVIYHANGGTATTDPVIRADVDPSAYRVETTGEVGFTAPSGKTFLTWSTEQDGSGTFYDPGAAIDIRPGDTLELWAQWFESTTPTPDLPDWNGLEITKVTDPETATVAPGEELTYKITVTNHTGVDLNNVVVVDTLPAGVTFVSASAGEPGNGTVEVTIPTLEKDGTYSFTVTVRVNDDTTGTITNTATIVSAVSGTTELGKDISASVTTPVEPKPGPAPDWDATLRITKEIPNMADGKVTLGDEFTYTITVWNSSDYTMENIVVSDTLPSEVDYVSCSGGLTYDSDTRTLTATIDSLDPGYKTFGITVRVADVSSDMITNTAKITHAECNGNVWDGVKEDTVSIGVVKPIEISKTVDKTTAAPGDTLTYTITVTNNISDAIILNVIDTLPQNIIVDEATISNDGYYDSAERTISWSVALSTKEVRELSFKAVIDADFAGDVIAANHVQTTFNDVVYAADSDPVEIKPSTEIKENVPVSVTVEFKGLGNVDRVPAGYKLTGDPANEILSGDIALGAATSRGGHIYKEFSDTAEVVLNKAYALTFVQSGYEVDGYDCDLEVTYTDSKTATDENKSINVYIELRYTKQNLVTCPSVTVRAYFKGVTELPANYELWCMQAPEEAIMFSGSLTTLLTKGVENGVPYVEFKATDVTLQAGVDLNFKFEQRNYNIDGYTCTTSSTEFTRNIALPVTDKIDPIVMEIENVYTKTDAEKTEMPATVKVEFVGLDKDTKLPAGYTLTGDKANEFLTGAIALTKDEAADTAVYTGKIQAVPGKAYDLKFAQTGFNVDGYKCDATAAVSKTVTADAKKGVEVTITLNYTKTDAEKTEMPVAVNVKFVGLDKDTKLPAYTLTGAPTNEFLSGAITLTKDETADTMTYTGKISAVPGKAYDLKFAQTGYNVDGYKCDATATVSKTVTADAKKGVEVTITLNYTKTDAEKTEMPVAVNVKFVGLDKDTKLPAYTLTGAPTNEFLSGAIMLTKDETADTMTYTGKIQAVPGKAYGLSFIQSGFDVAGFICDASVVVTKNVTADAKTGVVVDLVLTYTKINWGGLTITKTADKTYATPGSYVKYTITVTNKTGVDLTNVNVLDYLPSTVRYSSSFGGYNSGTSSWTIARLADGKSATATIRVKLNSGLSTGTKIENTAYVTSVTIDGQEYVFENLWLNDTAIVIVTDGKGAPKTGDESNLGLWIAVMAASLACAGAAAVIYKKRRTGND